MSVPPPHEQIWSKLIKGHEEIDFEWLAVRLFIGTAQRIYEINPDSLVSSVKNLHELFEKNQFLPTAKKDIDKIKKRAKARK